MDLRPEDPDELVTLVYDELRNLAHRYVRRYPRSSTIRPTALVHEAFIRLKKAKHIVWKGKTHFFAVAATQMRRILVEQARAAAAKKRGGGLTHVTLGDEVAAVENRTVELLALEEALRDLAEQSTRRARVAELRLFAGLSVEEVARVEEVSPRTVKEDWRVARAWLARELDKPAGDSL